MAARFAAASGARITAIYVLPEGVPTLFSGEKLYASGVLARQYQELAKSEANKALAVVEIEAEIAGVPYASVRAAAESPWRAILRAARSRHCDLIVMASHGRSGMKALALGSQTTRVLAHSKIPVLVCR